MFAVVTILFVQRPDNFIVDGPLQALSRPVYAVFMEPRRHLKPRLHHCRPVVAASDALAEVISLHNGGFLPVIIAAPLPVYFVGSVRHQHSRGDDACPGGGLH